MIDLVLIFHPGPPRLNLSSDAASPDNDVNTDPSTESGNRSSDALVAQTPDTLLLGLALLTNVIQEYKVSGQMLKNICKCIRVLFLVVSDSFT